MKYLYRIYQLLIAAPLLIIITIVTALATIIGSTIGSAHFWGYWPGHVWSRWFMRILLLPVHTEGHENIDHKTSYVFVATIRVLSTSSLSTAIWDATLSG